MFTISFLVPITLVIMMRWGWPSIIYAALGGLLYCILNKGSGNQFATYCLGNAFIGLMLIPLKLIGQDKINASWWGSVLFAVGAWVCVYLGRSLVWLVAYYISPVAGAYAYSGFTAFASAELLSFVITVVIVLVFRKVDGLYEDQHKYLKRVEKERLDKMKADEFGGELVEIDEEALQILNKGEDLYD
ncbi:MAG: hypothetical protein ACI4VK_04835 [Candidatus Coproplasma sp.]